ncbi:short-chain dehydrogenase/reductase family Oxidoreductase [Colletotrichum costaricense]|uniref:Short-chain dehydrogenase/reductase family Oxidoreductase n=1 Tax=Colletotrichum costaricense TaxID=1209916 RepID=A0AAI9Z8C3_9PEZI|nr:short-chain dehydrogenase/reductase family Oxidoreductase [Colletotrichum costaricense]KAK1538821.1 short-chain dehydrogenase/reductase family Oxidoreductase [Colletotrichum costaricense]
MANQWMPLKDMPNLKGKIAVVTGGNSDIGREIARLLAQKSAKVYFTTRSDTTAIKTRNRILEGHPEIDPENLQWMTMDVTDMRSVTSTVDKLKAKEHKVDILIHNAAAGTTSTELVGPGWEVHMATNFIGPFLLTNRMLPLLKNALKDKDADVRVVTMSSSAQVALVPGKFPFNFNSPDCFCNPVPSPPWQWRYVGRFIFGFDTIRYGVSKAANAILAQELQKRMDEQKLPILSMAVHPGEVATEGVFSINPSLIKTIARWTFIFPEQGAATPVFAAVSKEIRQDAFKYKGKFVFPGGKIGDPNPVASNEEQVTGLWRNANEEVNAQLCAQGLPGLQPW